MEVNLQLSNNIKYCYVCATYLQWIEVDGEMKLYCGTCDESWTREAHGEAVKNLIDRVIVLESLVDDLYSQTGLTKPS